MLAPPEYKPTLHFFDIVQLFDESNFTQWKNSISKNKRWKTSKLKWKPVCIEVNSTQLNIYQLKNQHDMLLINKMFDSCKTHKHEKHSQAQGTTKVEQDHLSKKLQNTRRVGQKPAASYQSRDELIKNVIANNVQLPEISMKSLVSSEVPWRSYTLQYSNVGCGYVDASESENWDPQFLHYNNKLYNTLRLRLQQDQILMKCLTPEKFENIYHNLCIARDISLPLEIREFACVRSTARKHYLKQRNEPHDSSDIANIPSYSQSTGSGNGSSLVSEKGTGISVSQGLADLIEEENEVVRDEFLNEYLMVSTSRFTPLQWEDPWVPVA